MKSLLENVEHIDMVIRSAQKMDSLMRSGQFIDAWREGRGLMAYLVRVKQEIIKDNQDAK